MPGPGDIVVTPAQLRNMNGIFQPVVASGIDPATGLLTPLAVNTDGSLDITFSGSVTLGAVKQDIRKAGLATTDAWYTTAVDAAGNHLSTMQGTDGLYRNRNVMMQDVLLANDSCTTAEVLGTHATWTPVAGTSTLGVAGIQLNCTSTGDLVIKVQQEKIQF